MAGGDPTNYSLPDGLRTAFIANGNPLSFVSVHAVDHVMTGSFYVTEMSVVTLKVARDPNIWQLFEPFSNDLWQVQEVGDIIMTHRFGTVSPSFFSSFFKLCVMLYLVSIRGGHGICLLGAN